jgi:predicted 2-oxoglutarate/Fe(II)-dependent dioxygenase YbiX
MKIDVKNLPSPEGQPVIIENYFTSEEATLMASHARKIQRPSQVPNIDGAYGFETSAQADRLSLEVPIAELTGDPEDDASILKFTQSVLDVKKDMEKFFGIELSLTNCNYAAMLPGSLNPLHSDSTELDGRAYHDDEETQYSALIYLNSSGEEYEGGDILFPKQKTRISPKVGTVVFFKGDHHYPHQVEKVISGERRTIVMFFGVKGHVSDRALFSDKYSGVPEEPKY